LWNYILLTEAHPIISQYENFSYDTNIYIYIYQEIVKCHKKSSVSLKIGINNGEGETNESYINIKLLLSIYCL